MSLAALLRYRLGTARLALARSWSERPLRLRARIFSPARELSRIVSRCRRADADPSFSLHVYESHQPVLLGLLESLPAARVLELGIGYGSTPIVLGRSGSSVSLETGEVWLRRFARYGSERHRILLVDDYSATEWNSPYFDQQWDVAFVDNSPASARQGNLLRLADTARFIVCHDTEECFVAAASNYGWDFSAFRYVWTYTRFASYTTVVSNVEPVPLEVLGGVSGQPPRLPRERPRGQVQP